MTKEKKRQRLFDRYKLKNKLRYSFFKILPDLEVSTRASLEKTLIYIRSVLN